MIDRLVGEDAMLPELEAAEVPIAEPNVGSRPDRVRLQGRRNRPMLACVDQGPLQQATR